MYQNLERVYSVNDKKIDEELDEALWKSKPVSSNDCTGLIADIPPSEDGLESYADLYDIPEQGNSNG